MNTTNTTWKLIALALALALILVAALGIGGWVVTRAYAQRPWGGHSGYGMMGGWGYSGYQGCGMMGSWGGTYPEGTETLTLEEAEAAVERSLKARNNDDLAVAEVMEFSNHFYAIVQEKSAGIGAFEVLVDKVTGAVSPEPGPNMMWNLKYGMMGGSGMGMMGGGYGYGGMMGGGRGYGGMMGGTTEPILSLDMPVEVPRHGAARNHGRRGGRRLLRLLHPACPERWPSDRHAQRQRLHRSGVVSHLAWGLCGYDWALTPVTVGAGYDRGHRGCKPLPRARGDHEH